MYEKKPVGWKKHLDFILVDFFILQLSLIIGYLIRYGVEVDKAVKNYVTVAVALAVSFMFVSAFHEGYRGIIKRGLYIEFVELLKQTVLVSLFTILLFYIMHDAAMLSRLAMTYTFTAYFVLAYTMRNLLKYFIAKNLKENSGSRSMIVVCMERKAEGFIERIKENNYDFNIQGIIVADKDMKGSTIDGIPVVANASDAVNYICRSWVDEVFIGKITNDSMPDFCSELKRS